MDGAELPWGDDSRPAVTGPTGVAWLVNAGMHDCGIWVVAHRSAPPPKQIAEHAARRRNLTREARSNPQRLERILSDTDHVASVIADIAPEQRSPFRQHP